MKEDRSQWGYKVVEFDRVRDLNNVKDLVIQLWALDWFDDDFSDNRWSGYDWSYSDTLFKKAYYIN